MATAGAGANPHAMPRDHVVYAVVGLVSCLLAFVVFWIAVPEIKQLWALGDLPPFSGGPIASGAVYRGTLEGPIETTPLGRPAVAWIGVVEQSTRSGKSTYTREKCRLGRVSELRLSCGGQRWKIAAHDDLRNVDLSMATRTVPEWQPRYWLGPKEAVAEVPDAVIARCHIDRVDLARGEWEYIEQAAAPGSNAEFAGCAVGDELRACGSANSLAAGHLSTFGIRAMVRRMADRLMQMVGGISLLMTFFTAFGAVNAVRALRRAAPREVLHPELWP
jgi:hypothetical protein